MEVEVNLWTSALDAALEHVGFYFLKQQFSAENYLSPSLSTNWGDSSRQRCSLDALYLFSLYLDL